MSLPLCTRVHAKWTSLVHSAWRARLWVGVALGGTTVAALALTRTWPFTVCARGAQLRKYSRDWINEVDYPPYPTGTAANTHARIMLYLSDLYALAQETPADKSIELPDYYHHSPCDTIVFKEWETRLHRLWEKLTKAETARIKMSISQRKGLMYVRVDRDDEGVMTQAVMECRRRGTIEREDLPYKK
jgi:hypothetical protein